MCISKCLKQTKLENNPDLDSEKWWWWSTSTAQIWTHPISPGQPAEPPQWKAASLCEGGRSTTHSPTLAVMKSVMNVCVLILSY